MIHIQIKHVVPLLTGNISHCTGINFEQESSVIPAQQEICFCCQLYHRCLVVWWISFSPYFIHETPTHSSKKKQSQAGPASSENAQTKFAFFGSILKTTSQSLLCYSACLFRNSLKLKDFHSVLFVHIKRGPHVLHCYDFIFWRSNQHEQFCCK